MLRITATITCDFCKNTFPNTLLPGNPDTIRGEAEMRNWFYWNGRDYCPRCRQGIIL